MGQIKFLDTEKSSESDYQNLLEKILDSHSEEIVIGLCGFIGTNIGFVAKELEKILVEVYRYEVEVLKLSDFIKEVLGLDIPDDIEPEERFNRLIVGGNELRDKHGDTILAELAIKKIAYNREIHKNAQEKEGYTSMRKCYIVNSIKHKGEYELFKAIYSDLFYQIGIFSHYSRRVQSLVDLGVHKNRVHELINKDTAEETKSGQQVYKTFVLSDFFLRLDGNDTTVDTKLRRYIELIFEADVVTPSTDETAMYAASSAAGNSACLSRQVGAALTDQEGNILSLGWNDVPKFRGGVYAFDGVDYLKNRDFRCMNLDGGKCFNDVEKYDITKSLIRELVNGGFITLENQMAATEVIKKSKIKELIEFSRAVHAEMLAIINGGKNAGSKIVDGKLYCTTYPCHNCARHIVAAGIKEVYYIEPYLKSLAVKLHHDAVSESETEANKVRILMYEGVAPRRYLDFFRMHSDRKQARVKTRPDKTKMTPKKTLSLQAIPILEGRVVEGLVNKKMIHAQQNDDPKKG